MDVVLKAAGDNKNGELLWNGADVSLGFVNCQTSSIFGDHKPAHIAVHGEHMAILLNNGHVHLFGSNISTKTTFKQIALNDSNFFGIKFTGEIESIGPERYDLNAIKASFITATNGRLVVITTDGTCKLLTPDTSVDICTDAVAAGVNSESVYVVTRNALIIYENNRQTKLEVPEKLFYVSCSDANTYLIGVSGNLYRFAGDGLIRVFGLPPVVSVSAGIQHTGAVSCDGRLYMWGFNPLGQLGTGTVKPTTDPICVAKNVIHVACGNCNTWMLESQIPVVIPDAMKRCQTSSLEPQKRILPHELLF